MHTTFFGPISWYAELLRNGGVECIDGEEQFVKQTVRSRCRIATANGIQTLSVPVDRHKGAIRDVRISDHGDWRRVHWNALSSAYGESPFFDYYADDLHPFFEKRWEFLYDYNMEIAEKVIELLNLPDDRPLSELFAHEWQSRPYYQVFGSRHGFLPDLSILDLLFNQGNEAALYL